MEDKTSIYTLEDIEEQEVLLILRDVKNALKEKGYNPINQIVGYLMSGDPGYISSYKGARSKMTNLNREKILEVLLKKEFE